jgi:hypothetical protein
MELEEVSAWLWKKIAAAGGGFGAAELKAESGSCVEGMRDAVIPALRRRLRRCSG